MRAAISLAVLVMAAACQRQEPPQANLTANAPVDIEVLPQDESATTPTNQLENGVDEPDVNAMDNAMNGD